MQGAVATTADAAIMPMGVVISTTLIANVAVLQTGNKRTVLRGLGAYQTKAVEIGNMKTWLLTREVGRINHKDFFQIF